MLFKKKHILPKLKNVDDQIVFVSGTEIAEYIWDSRQDELAERSGTKGLSYYVSWNQGVLTIHYLNDDGRNFHNIKLHPRALSGWCNKINGKSIHTPVTAYIRASSEDFYVHCVYGIGDKNTGKISPIKHNVALKMIEKQNKHWFYDDFIHPNGLSDDQEDILYQACNEDDGKPLEWACKVYGVMYCITTRNIIRRKNNGKFYYKVMMNGD